MSLLELHAVGARRGGAVVLENVSASVNAGEVVGLLGPNGAGKTTLMRAALGLCPAQGEIHLGGRPLAGLSPRARALAAAYIPQDRSIAWPITVATLAALGRIPHRTDARTDRAAVDAALDAVDLARLRDRPATRLSGGERARALIARALAQEAPLILADEPISGLDPAHALALMAQFRDIARAGRGVLVALHDLGLAARWCDRLILLDRGRHVLDGPPARVLTRETLSQVYGIDAHIDAAPDGLLVVPTGLAALP